MKTLKLLNKNFLSILFIIYFIALSAKAEDEPIDIWNIDKQKLEKKSNSENSLVTDEDIKKISPDIYNMQSQKNSSVIKQDEILDSKDIKITGLYDPEDFSLDINMWSNS